MPPPTWIVHLLDLQSSGRRIRMTLDSSRVRADDVTDMPAEEATDEEWEVWIASGRETGVEIPDPHQALDDVLAYLGFLTEGA